MVPNIPCADLAASRAFYEGVLGFRAAMDMGWIVTLVSPDNPTAQVSLVRDEVLGGSRACGPMSLTVEVDDVDAMHAAVVARGAPVVYPLTDEPWGVRRFHVVDPSGVVVNVMRHLP